MPTASLRNTRQMKKLQSAKSRCKVLHKIQNTQAYTSNEHQLPQFITCDEPHASTSGVTPFHMISDSPPTTSSQ